MEEKVVITWDEHLVFQTWLLNESQVRLLERLAKEGYLAEGFIFDVKEKSNLEII